MCTVYKQDANGICLCKLGIGSNYDCSEFVPDCNKPYGEYVPHFPQGQCDCQLNEKRGGEHCEVIYCMNECNGQICSEGLCECGNEYLGIDCSIIRVPFLRAYYIMLSGIFFIVFMFI